jgi:hypothetical protein
MAELTKDRWVLIRGQWYHLESVHEDSIFVSDKDGNEKEFDVDDIEDYKQEWG